MITALPFLMKSISDNPLLIYHGKILFRASLMEEAFQKKMIPIMIGPLLG